MKLPKQALKLTEKMRGYGLYLWHGEKSGLGLVLVTWFVFFSRILSGKFVYFHDDLKAIFYPLEIAYGIAQAQWHLPVWSNLFGFGQPLIAWGQLGFFTPLHIILRPLLDPLNLLQISIVAYFLIGALGFYVWLRRQALFPLAAALGAIIYTFSGFNIGHLNHVNFYTGTMLLPWLLVAIHYFLGKPTYRTCLLLSLGVAAIFVSAQPQTAMYCVVIAALYGMAVVIGSMVVNQDWTWLRRVGLLTVLAAIIAFGLTSFAILPLFEFIPLTERGADLPITELLEFSYPPSHAITLVMPYFFGDHSHYWGAKSFQELAAYVGILPLLLAGVSLSSWHRFRVLKLTALALLSISILGALGQYSPLYKYLVEQHIITALNIPGRFVFFFTTAIALLAPIGLADLLSHRATAEKNYWSVKICAVVGALALPLILLAPFLYALIYNPAYHARLLTLVANKPADMALMFISLGVFGISLHQRLLWFAKWSIPLLTAVTLVYFGWSYNPVLPRTAHLKSPFLEQVQNQEVSSNIPARLYAREELILGVSQQDNIPTPIISTSFTIYQAIAYNPLAPCYTIQLHADNSTGKLILGAHEKLGDPAIDQIIINGADLLTQEDQIVCLQHIPQELTSLFLSLSSDHDSGINAYYRPTTEPSIYFVRVQHPTATQLAASKKPGVLQVKQITDTLFDPATAIASRHLNVAARASSARWIGALSIKPYRDFIEFFFANDSEPIDGDGQHILERQRAMVDFMGISHLAGIIPARIDDKMPDSGFQVIAETQQGEDVVRLYQNPQAYPKAFFVPKARFEPAADEIRAQLRDPDFDVRQTIFVSGPVPPDEAQLRDNAGEADVRILDYRDTKVTVAVAATAPGWLVISDTSTPQWHATVDGQPQPYLVANSFLKTAYVPAGEHTVSFYYDSPAINLASRLTIASLLLTVLLLVPYKSLYRRLNRMYGFSLAGPR